MGLALLLALACAPPEGEWWAITADGALVGRERRVAAGADELREREWSLLLGGRAVRDRSTSLVRRAPDGSLRSLIRDGALCWEGEAGVAWLLEDAGLGEAQVLDPQGCEVVPALISADGTWRQGAASGRMERDVAGVVSAVSIGLLRAARVPARPDWPAEAPDLQRLFSVPTRQVSGARGAWTVRFAVRGLAVPAGPDQVVRDGLVVVTAPLRAELPQGEALARVDAAVARLAVLPDRAGVRSRSAEEVLAGGGDCEDRARALVDALAGLDTEVRCGLVYLADPPGLYPHAWAAVRLGERWVPVDPTLGQVPADAARLELGCGWGSLAELGGAQLEIEEAR
ncbi:MAG: transglutaminase domain-containing protein [Deltaproteobacteria bacterium]|nr:transglutaminase domain-containing protein [Deltaproteobacteria bacterium]